MHNFLDNVAQWFVTHDLMGVEAAGWTAWALFMLIPIVTIIWWGWLLDSALNNYSATPNADNKKMVFFAYVAPVSIPVLFLMAGILWTGRKAKML